MCNLGYPAAKLTKLTDVKLETPLTSVLKYNDSSITMFSQKLIQLAKRFAKQLPNKK